MLDFATPHSAYEPVGENRGRFVVEPLARGFGYTFGAALGPYVTGYLFDVTQSYNLALIICAGTSVISLIIAFFVRPVKSAIYSSSRV